MQATDSDGAAGNTDSITVTVANVAPTVALSGDSLGQRGRHQDLHVHGHRPRPGHVHGRPSRAAPTAPAPTRQRRPLPVHVPGRAGELERVGAGRPTPTARRQHADSITVTVANVAPTVALSGDPRSTRATPRPTRTRSPTRARIPPDQRPSRAAPTAPVPTRRAPTTSSARSRTGRRARACGDGDRLRRRGRQHRPDSITVTVANVAPTVALSGDPRPTRATPRPTRTRSPTPARTRTRRSESCGANGTRPTRRRRPLPVHVPGRAGELERVKVQATDSTATADNRLRRDHGHGRQRGADGRALRRLNSVNEGDTRPTRTRSPTRARTQPDASTESCGANGTRPTRRRRPLPVHVPGRAGELERAR